MAKYKDLEIPKTANNSYLNFNKIQEAYCRASSMECIANCSKCLYSRENIDAFQELYTSKNIELNVAWE